MNNDNGNVKYLTKVVETYRLETEKDVEQFLSELKADPNFAVVKYSSTKKQIKSKGEIVDEYIHFEVTKVFNDEKEPDTIVQISYEVE